MHKKWVAWTLHAVACIIALKKQAIDVGPSSVFDLHRANKLHLLHPMLRQQSRSSGFSSTRPWTSSKSKRVRFSVTWPWTRQWEHDDLSSPSVARIDIAVRRCRSRCCLDNIDTRPTIVVCSLTVPTDYLVAMAKNVALKSTGLTLSIDCWNVCTPIADYCLHRDKQTRGPDKRGRA